MRWSRIALLAGVVLASRITTGQPNAGSPATRRLPPIGWVIRDPGGKIVASKSPHGKMEGKLDPEKLDTYSVFIAKRFAAEENS